MRLILDGNYGSHLQAPPHLWLFLSTGSLNPSLTCPISLPLCTSCSPLLLLFVILMLCFCWSSPTFPAAPSIFVWLLLSSVPSLCPAHSQLTVPSPLPPSASSPPLLTQRLSAGALPLCVQSWGHLLLGHGSCDIRCWLAGCCRSGGCSVIVTTQKHKAELSR